MIYTLPYKLYGIIIINIPIAFIFYGIFNSLLGFIAGVIAALTDFLGLYFLINYYYKKYGKDRYLLLFNTKRRIQQ